MSHSFADLSAQTPAGKVVNFDSFEGKAVLIVNTATKCGLAPQFDGLEQLHQQFKDQGLVVLGFPCDQFAHQEPVKDDEMEQVCKVNFGVTFPLMAKVEVNGPGTHPVYQYLKSKKLGFLSQDIKWNFTKFLISKDRKKIKRYSPTTEPKALVKDIVAALG